MPPDDLYPAGLDACIAACRHLLDRHGAGGIVVGSLSAGLLLLTPEPDLTESGDTFQTLRGIDVVQRLPYASAKALYAGRHPLDHLMSRRCSATSRLAFRRPLYRRARATCSCRTQCAFTGCSAGFYHNENKRSSSFDSALESRSATSVGYASRRSWETAGKADSSSPRSRSRTQRRGRSAVRGIVVLDDVDGPRSDAADSGSLSQNPRISDQGSRQANPLVPLNLISDQTLNPLRP